MKKYMTFINIAVCFVLTVFLCLALHVYALADSDGDQIYNFNVSYSLDSRSTYYDVLVQGKDVDFKTLVFFYGGNKCCVEFLGVSSDFFIYSNKSHDMQDFDKLRDADYDSSRGIYFSHLFDISISYAEGAIFSVSGYPNVEYIYLDESLSIIPEIIRNEYYDKILDEYVENGGIRWEPVDLDKDGVLDLNMEIPVIKMDPNGDGGYDFVFDNAAYDTYFELQGRWYTVDDINLFKENAVWKYSYQSLLKSDLTTWVSPDDKATSIGTYDLCDVGGDAFNSFLNAYPIESRSYTGGTNALGNWLNG